MARRKPSGTVISLFPFLSILAALIGALVVLIAGMAIIQLQKADGQEPEEVQRAKENNRLLAEIDKLREKEDELRQLLKSISSRNEKIRLKMTQRNALKSVAENVEQAEGSLLERKILLDQLRETNIELVADFESLKEEIEALRKQIEDEEDAEEETPPIQVRPGSSSRGRKPYFVEVSPAKISVLRKDKEAVEIPVASLKSSPEFRKFLEFIDRNPDTQIVFLIRNSAPAVQTYREANQVIQTFARTEARRTNFRAVKMPLPGTGELDLSLFSQLMN